MPLNQPPPLFARESNPLLTLIPTTLHTNQQDAEKASPFVEEEINDTPSTRRIETPAQRGQRRRTTAVTNAAFIVERIDENVLPGSYVAISSSKSALNGVGLTQLSQITLWRGVTQALLSPLAGLFGDRVNRVYVIGFASFLWGIMTIAMGLAQTYGQMLAFSCVNGLGLALLIPCVQSLLADYYTPANRGRAFGLLYFTSSLGELEAWWGGGVRSEGLLVEWWCRGVPAQNPDESWVGNDPLSLSALRAWALPYLTPHVPAVGGG